MSGLTRAPEAVVLGGMGVLIFGAVACLAVAFLAVSWPTRNM
jgi:xanthine/uracil permease